MRTYASLSSRHRLELLKAAKPLATIPRHQNNSLPLPEAWNATRMLPGKNSFPPIPPATQERQNHILKIKQAAEAAPLLFLDKPPQLSPRKLKRSSSHRASNTKHSFDNFPVDLEDRDLFSTSPPPTSIIGLHQIDSSPWGGYNTGTIPPNEEINHRLVPEHLFAGAQNTSLCPTEGIRSSPHRESGPSKSSLASLISSLLSFAHNTLDFLRC